MIVKICGIRSLVAAQTAAKAGTDLIVELLAPDNTVYTLQNRTGGSADNIVKTFTTNLSSETINGAWKLRVKDRASTDTGYINSWSITM